MKRWKELYDNYGPWAVTMYNPDLVSIDPGVAYYAEATWVGRSLDTARLVKNTDPVVWSVNAFVIESQYLDRRGAARTDDVIALAQAAGRIAANYPDARWVLPGLWKGGVPKSAHQKRIRAVLTSEEGDKLAGMNKGTLKQVLDAIGLGLWALGRL